MSKNFHRIKPRFWAFLLGVLTLTCTAVYLSQDQYMTQQGEILSALSSERAALLEETSILQRKIDFTYTDEFIEREARSKLGLIKEDEILFETND